MNHSFALIDCNNFYVSCERLFATNLKNKPVVVLSNNDGCIISLSDEAKDLSVKRGVPYFKVKHLIDKHDIRVFSSNYELYGDMSRRIMNILKSVFADVEIYSIDEVFIRVENSKYFIEKLKKVTTIIQKNTGIPVSLGFGKSKTLAKLANYIAKKYLKKNKIYLLEGGTNIDYILQKVDVKNIWGIGTKYAQRLKSMGIENALQLSKANTDQMRKLFNINISRIIMELNGFQCLDLETVVTRKSITVSRSFGKVLTKLDELKTALSYYCGNACLKARKLCLKPQALLIFLQTNFYSASAQYSNSHIIKLDIPTNDTITINKACTGMMKKLYRSGYNYHKVGITLLDLIANNYEQGLMLVTNESKKNKKIMMTLDSINNKYGRNTIFLASQGTSKDWMIKRKYKSPEYTTNWKELPLVC